MPRHLNLAELVQEHDTFTDVDGTVYELRNRGEFSAVDMARLAAMQKRAEGTLAAMQGDQYDEGAAQALETLLDDMLALIAPAVPQTRWPALALGLKVELVRFWSEAGGGEDERPPLPGQAGQAMD